MTGMNSIMSGMKIYRNSRCAELCTAAVPVFSVNDDSEIRINDTVCHKPYRLRFCAAFVNICSMESGVFEILGIRVEDQNS